MVDSSIRVDEIMMSLSEGFCPNCHRSLTVIFGFDLADIDPEDSLVVAGACTEEKVAWCWTQSRIEMRGLKVQGVRDYEIEGLITLLPPYSYALKYL